MNNDLFPKVKKSINDLIDDEEGIFQEVNLLLLGQLSC